MWLEETTPEIIRHWLRHSKHPKLVMDCTGSLLWCNSALEELVGYSVYELQAMTIAELIDRSSDMEDVRKLMAETVAGKRTNYISRREYRRKNSAETVPVQVHVMRFEIDTDTVYLLMDILPLEASKTGALLLDVESSVSRLTNIADATHNGMKSVESTLDRLVKAIESLRDASTVTRVLDWAKESPLNKGLLVSGILLLVALLFGSRIAELGADFVRAFTYAP